MSDKEQLTFDDTPLWNRYQDTFALIAKGHFKKALHNYEELLNAGAEIQEIFSLMKCMKYWIPRFNKLENLSPGNERAEFLRLHWDQFEQFLQQKGVGHVERFELIKQAVYKHITDNLIYAFQNADMTSADLLISLAEAFMATRTWQKARDTLIYALKFRRSDPMIYALLGEVYFNLDDQKKALLHYRKAFYLDAEQIQLSKLTSPVITDLKLLTEEKGFINKEVNLWLPIYAAINNIFCYKEKLGEKEYHTLIKKLKTTEKKYYMASKSRGRLEPLLLNYYIVLIDHYYLSLAEGNDLAQTKLKSYLIKIKNINDTVYEKIRINYE